MKIALVCPYNLERPGGVKSHILGLGHALQERGHSVEVIGPNPDGSVDGLPLVGCGRSRKLAFGGTQIDVTWASPRQVLEVSRRNYDLLHFHTLWNPFFPFQLATCFRGTKVATFHDVPGRETPTWARAIMPWASRLLRWLWVPQVVAVSPLAGAHLRPGTFEIIPNGLWLPTALPPEGERRALLFVGRLEPRKGLATLLRALHRMGKTAPPLWVAGEGYLRAELEQLAGNLDVQFLGEVSEQRKWELLRQARLLVAPSTGGESFGIVLTEAMACGTPPLAADNPGYREVLKERSCQLIFPVDDDRELAARLERLCQVGEEWASLQEWCGQEWVRYDWRRLVVPIEAFYARALGQKKVARPRVRERA